jgi:hypothetical protein
MLPGGHRAHRGGAQPRVAHWIGRGEDGVAATRIGRGNTTRAL